MRPPASVRLVNGALPKIPRECLQETADGGMSDEPLLPSTEGCKSSGDVPQLVHVRGQETLLPALTQITLNVGTSRLALRRCRYLQPYPYLAPGKRKRTDALCQGNSPQVPVTARPGRPWGPYELPRLP